MNNLRIYEFFRKTRETYLVIKLNIDGVGIRNVNINLFFFKHLIENFIINSSFNLSINVIGDLYIDYHHLIEDIGISMGISFKNAILKKNIINRYGFSFIPLDESISFVSVDICGRSYLIYNIFLKEIYLNNFDIRLIYDFFISFVLNSNITLHINNIYGLNTHHKLETIFKAFGLSIFKSLKIVNKINSTKGMLS